MDQIKVLVVDDYSMIRVAFESIFQGTDRYELVDTLSSAQEAVSYVKSHAVDLILMDIVMAEGISGLEAAKQIKELHPGIRIILVTSMPEVSYINRAREMGVDSFWYKETQGPPILAIMDRTMAGENVYPDAAPSIRIGNALSDEFTAREIEILRELVGGATNTEIASKLGISGQTVKMHITNMLQKTGFRNRLELAVKVRTDGFIIND